MDCFNYKVQLFFTIGGMSIENSVPVVFYEPIVLFFVGGYHSFSVLKKKKGYVFVVCLGTARELGDHVPCFFGVVSEVTLLALLSEFKLPLMFGSSLFS